jgi:hypothetical protein
MQPLPRFRRADIALSSLGILSIEQEIDKKKILFFGQLCNLDKEKIVKTKFDLRIQSFMKHLSKTLRLIPYIYSQGKTD